MNGEGRGHVHQSARASPWQRERAHELRPSITLAGADEASGVRQVAEAVGRCITFDAAELPEEFFPAHLSVAIVEAVFRFEPGHGAQSSQVAKRYCRRFGLAHTRRDMFDLPPVDEQETIAELIGHYDERGVERMANEVFETSCSVPGTMACSAETVVRIAEALRRVGVDVLQDVQDLPAHDLEEALCSVPGTDRAMARLLLTYAGDDDFVVGDDYVRRFVAEATGHRTVSASWATHLVCQAAYQLALSPRHLDYRIYRCLVGR